MQVRNVKDDPKRPKKVAAGAVSFAAVYAVVVQFVDEPWATVIAGAAFALVSYLVKNPKVEA